MNWTNQELRFVRSYLIHLKCYKDVGIFEPWQYTLLQKVDAELKIRSSTLQDGID